MPVTIRPTSNPPREWRVPKLLAENDPDVLLKGACKNQHKRSKRILQTSFSQDRPDDSRVNLQQACPLGNGFVKAAFLAYSNHHHLTIRPDDVWFSILSQISFYVNAHAESLRSTFVAHEGKKEVKVTAAGTLKSVDVGELAVDLTKEMDKYLVDKSLKDWILPDFTTTTRDDTVTAAVMMMGTMKEYFEFKMSLVCGIPSVTLLGEKEDWVKIRERLDRITSILGSGDGTADAQGEKGEKGEPELFAERLRFVLDNFIRTIDNDAKKDDGEAVNKFWSHIASHVSGGSGPTFLSGWITAFCFWKSDGGRPSSSGMQSENAEVTIDGVHFTAVDTSEIPEGYVEVPVTVDDNGTVYKTEMVAGSVGVKLTSSGEFLDEAKGRMGGPEVGEKTGLDSVQPLSGWWMYELKTDEEMRAEEEAEKERRNNRLKK